MEASASAAAAPAEAVPAPPIVVQQPALKSKMIHQEADLVEQVVRAMKPIFEAQLAEMHKLAKAQQPP